jgi:hypothetical protein
MKFGVQFFPSINHYEKNAREYYSQSLTLAEA